MKIRQEAQHPPPQTQAERKGVHTLLIQAVFDIGTPILHTLICAALNLMFSKTETTIRPNSSVLIRWGTPQNFLLAFIDELWNFWKIRILKKWKKHCWRYHHFKHLYQKPQSYEVKFLRYGVWQIFFVILGHFLPFYPPPPYPPITSQKTNFWKKHLQMSYFKLVQQKAQSYGVCLLRYGEQQTILLF